MRMEEKMFDKELEMQQEARQFQIQMMQMMTSLVHDHSMPSSLPPPITTSTQYHITTCLMMITCLMMMIPRKSNSIITSKHHCSVFDAVIYCYCMHVL